MKVSALDAALNAVWAMEEQALEALLAIAARENDVTPEALEAYTAKSMANAEKAKVRNGVAIIEANGPLFRRANIMTAISGATSYDVMRRDIQAALDDPTVHAILLNIDSPGGEVNGANELGQAVHDARGKKPIVAYVGGSGASAAYWVASAADKVVASPTAVLGSIGVQVAFKEQAAKAGEKSYRFVSSQSPNKNPDIGTEEAANQIQSTIDAMAQVFVETVARNRGVATETVLTNFGGGGTFVGQAAVDAGLADSTGSFEAVLAELSGGHLRGTKHTGARAKMADNNTFTAEERDGAISAALAAERGRVADLRKLAGAHGATDAELTAAIDGNVTVAAFAVQMADKAEGARAAAAAAAETARLAAETAARTEEETRLAALKRDEESASGAGISPGGESGEGVSAADKLANEIIASAAAVTGSN